MNITPLDAWIRGKIGAEQPLLTRQALEAWQLERLNETLALVRKRSAFYRECFAGMPENIQSLQELRQFPFTTADDVRREPLRFLCVSQDEILRVVTLQTSGTTGLPKRFFFTAEDQELTVDFFGVGMNTLTKPGDRVLILLPGEKPGSVGDLLRLGLLRQGRAPIPHGPDHEPIYTLDVMQDIKADCLVGSPVQVLGLARRWALRRDGRHKPSSVLLSTDYVPDAIVSVLNEIWGCEVFNHYGATEMGLGGGVECEAHGAYHLREADLLFEIVDPHTGEAVEDGAYGEVVVSTLTRRGMPLIRYRMGDISRFLPEPCACGSMLKRMETIKGRYENIMRIGDTLLSLAELDETLFAIPGVMDFSVSLEGDGEKPALEIDIQTLTDEDCIVQAEEVLRGIPAISGANLTINCRRAAAKPVSLRKRVSAQR